MTWSLLEPDGTVVNEREDVTVSPAESVTIVLSGDDLAMDEAYDVERILLIEGTYDSDLGSDLPLRDQLTFTIEDLVGVEPA